MARCRFPHPVVRGYYRTGKSSGCDATAKYEITYQGRKIMVCKTHSQFDGRNKPN